MRTFRFGKQLIAFILKQADNLRHCEIAPSGCRARALPRLICPVTSSAKGFETKGERPDLML